MHNSALRGRRTVPYILARLRLLLFAVVASLASHELYAAVISRDWKTPGDGLLTYDDVNQREWLDLTESRLAMFPAEMRLQQLLIELGPGGKFEGFVWSKSGDLRDFATSAGIDVTLDDFSHNEAPTTNLMSLVGVSVSFNNVQSYGLLNEVGMLGPFVFQNVGTLSVSPDSGPNGQAGLIIGMPGDLAFPSNTGVWIYRAVPEMSGKSLAMVGIAVMLSSRRKLALSVCSDQYIS